MEEQWKDLIAAIGHDVTPEEYEGLAQEMASLERLRQRLADFSLEPLSSGWNVRI